jgi:hypothetical protein
MFPAYKNKKAKIILVALLIVFFALPLNFTIAANDTDQVTITTTVEETISLSCDATLALGTLTPGTAVDNSVTCTTTTNAGAGYNLAVERDDATTTMDLISDGATNITDKTAWDYSVPNGALWTGTGLGFRVMQTGTTAGLYSSTFWGTSDAIGDALYAGFPASYEVIAETSSYSGTATDVEVEARLDVAGTQPGGAYDGTITFQATTNP